MRGEKPLKQTYDQLGLIEPLIVRFPFVVDHRRQRVNLRNRTSRDPAPTYPMYNV